MSAGRFMLFDIPAYYPEGGISDLVGRFDTLEQAMAQEKRHREGHIYDVETGITVAARYGKQEWVLTPAAGQDPKEKALANAGG